MAAAEERAAQARRVELKLFSLLARVRDCVQQRNGQMKSYDLWRAAERVRDKIEPVLRGELLASPGLTDEQIRARIKALVDERLDAAVIEQSGLEAR